MDSGGIHLHHGMASIPEWVAEKVKGREEVEVKLANERCKSTVNYCILTPLSRKHSPNLFTSEVRVIPSVIDE